MKRKKFFRRLLWTIVTLFILANVVANFHAYKFTHFTNDDVVKTKSKGLSTGEKVTALFFGINNPRPANKATPSQKYETIYLQSNKRIECWSIKTEHAKGTVILFHGYSGEKSGMLDKSDEFLKMGYNTFLVDFMGAGGSEGIQTTIGYKEAEEVKTCYDHISKSGERNIYLFGTSMGAAAVLKAMHDYPIDPAAIILECPFGSLYQTVSARFTNMGVPSFPMAVLLTFWGGVQNGFWAFGYKPIRYARSVKCPALLLYGEKDDRVSREEIDKIYKNLGGRRQLNTYPMAAHENYLVKYKDQWVQDVSGFLQHP